MQKLPVSLTLPLGLIFGSICMAQQPTTSQPVDPARLSANAMQAQQQQLDRYRKLAEDYGQLSRYASANAALPPVTADQKRVIFYGDSITDSWHLDEYFSGKGYINRGISGQTTPQMLVRYWQDVIDLHPAVVVLLAGTNDLAGNTGPESVQQIEDDYATMAELARVHGFQLVFSSVTPVSSYGPAGAGMTSGRPPAKILELNTWLKQYCSSHGLVYLDYFSAMVDDQGMMKRGISNDGLHPNAAGYAIMAPLAQAAVEKALALPMPKAEQ
jgi:lysophospholipase L1-like esterase